MLFAIIPSRCLNNGQPSMHAALLRASSIVEGQHAVHVGAGTGYYSAIMARLVEASGRVTAIELNVRVIHANGVDADYDTADVIYINAGVTKPADAWLDRLCSGGRLILPLTTDPSLQPTASENFDVTQMLKRGAVFKVQRQGNDFDAEWLFTGAYILAEGMRDAESEAALAKPFESGDAIKVTRLYRTYGLPGERCWLRGRGWCLAYNESGSRALVSIFFP